MNDILVAFTEGLENISFSDLVSVCYMILSCLLTLQNMGEVSGNDIP